jgi:citrate lyase alpha subunit
MNEENTKPFVVKDSITVEGITENFVWYHSKILTEKMQGWQTEFERIVKVMESRHSEHLEIIRNLLAENSDLKRKVKQQ